MGSAVVGRSLGGMVTRRSGLGAGLGVGVHMASFSNLRPPGVAFIPIADAPTAKLLLVWRGDDEREILNSFIHVAREVARSREPPAVFSAVRS